MASILVVDDDKHILKFLREILSRMGHQLTTADNGARALEILEEHDFELIVSDLQMPRVDGIRVLKASKTKNPDTEVLILTGYGSIKSAVRAMKAGAFEYLSKPVDVDELRIKVKQALDHRSMKIKIEKQKQELAEFHEMIARDLKLAEQVQDSLVPQPFDNHRIGVGVKYMPMIGVGGDYADIYFDGVSTVYLTIVDVTGHGITAALLVNRVCNEVRKLIREKLAPNQIITSLNNFIVDVFSQTGMFLTMFSCMIDLDELKCTYAGNAHPAAILWKKEENSFRQLASQNTIVGFDKVKNGVFLQDEIPVSTGDKIFMYTDGLTEIENAEKKQLGVDGLINALEHSIQAPTQELPELIIQDLSSCCEGQIRDDIFLIAAEIK